MTSPKKHMILGSVWYLLMQLGYNLTNILSGKKHLLMRWWLQQRTPKDIRKNAYDVTMILVLISCKLENIIIGMAENIHSREVVANSGVQNC